MAFLLGREFSFARSLLAVLTRAPLRVGFAQEYHLPVHQLRTPARYRDALRIRKAPPGISTALGLHPGDALPGWRLPEADTRWANQMIHFRKPDTREKLIAVDPGIGKGSHRLAERSFAQIVSQIASRYPSKVLVVSNNLEAKSLDRFKESLNADLFDLTPKNVKEALALLSRADLLLAGNTDFFHFSVGMRLPSIGFFTRHDEANWFPKGASWVQIIQGVKGQKMSLEEVFSKIDTLLHLTGEKNMTSAPAGTFNAPDETGYEYVRPAIEIRDALLEADGSASGHDHRFCGAQRRVADADPPFLEDTPL